MIGRKLKPLSRKQKKCHTQFVRDAAKRKMQKSKDAPIVQQGDLVSVNKWSLSSYSEEGYPPEIDLKQQKLFEEFSFMGIVLEATAEMCLVWVLNLEKQYYFYYDNIKSIDQHKNEE